MSSVQEDWCLNRRLNHVDLFLCQFIERVQKGINLLLPSNRIGLRITRFGRRDSFYQFAYLALELFGRLSKRYDAQLRSLELEISSAHWVSQRELLEQNAAQQQKLLSEFQTALGKSQTAWSEQAKALAQQSLNAGLQAARDSRLKPLLKSEP